MSPRQLHRRTVGARERGAVLVQVALAMTVLGGFCAMSIDFGLLMAARGQVQTAADAGALAGAIALGFDEVGPVTDVKKSASAVAVANLVAQSAPDVTIGDVNLDSFQFQVPGFPQFPSPQPVWNSVAVNAHRNKTHGNALPTFFGQLVGIRDQGVQAAATAMMVPSNASDCIWPIAIPDFWVDKSTVAGAPAPTFVKYAATGPPTLAPAPRDTYTPPSFNPTNNSTSTGGYSVPFSGRILPVRLSWPLTLTNVMDVTLPAERGRFLPAQVPRHDGGGFASNLASCNSSDDPVKIEPTYVPGDGYVERLNVEPAGTLAAVLAAAAVRIAADPGASWGPSNQVVSSCAKDPVPCASMSPRLVVLPVFDLNRYEETRWPAGATPKIRVVNFVGFFIKRVIGTSIEGQLTVAPGRVVMGKPMVGYGSAFLRTTFLSR